jgi:hypothetical protein
MHKRRPTEDDEIHFKTPEEKARFEREMKELLNDLHEGLTKIINESFKPRPKKKKKESPKKL